MSVRDLLIDSYMFHPKNGAFTSLDRLKTEDLTPFRGVHQFETCLDQVLNGSIYMNHFYYLQELELSCEVQNDKNILFLTLMPSPDRAKKWPISVFILQLQIAKYKELASSETKMNYVVSLNHQLVTMANSISISDTEWVRWSDGKIGRNPKSPAAVLAALTANNSKPKKSWWSF